jgi:hypothetical protein
MRRVPALVLTGVAAGALALPACDKQTVQVGFRPVAGTTYRYELRVRSTTTTRLGDDAPERSVDDAVLESHDTVLSSTPEEVRVQVVLTRSGSPDRTFVVRFDRFAQLAGVEAVDGLPPGVLGPGAFPEFLPAAVTAPPDRPLVTGERWKIDARPNLPGTPPDTRLQGSGRLVSVGESGGRKVASVKAETRLPLRSSSTLRDAAVSLEGVETTTISAKRALSDGSVQSSTSVTKGTFALTLTPPASTGGSVNGTLQVEIRSTTQRLPDEDGKKG